MVRVRVPLGAPGYIMSPHELNKAKMLWELVNGKFKSGNGIEVERVSINKREMDLIDEAADQIDANCN
jgi:hypothetical protein